MKVFLHPAHKSNCDVLYKYFITHFPDYPVCIIYEAGCGGFQPARDLLDLDWELRVIGIAGLGYKNGSLNSASTYFATMNVFIRPALRKTFRQLP